MANRRIYSNGRWREGTDNNNSMLHDVVVAAPVVAGLGVGVRNLMNRKRVSTVQPTISNLSRPKPTVVDFSTTLELLGKTNPTPEAVTHAWQTAVQAADPGMILRRPTLDSNKPLATIQSFHAMNKSPQAEKAVSFFMRNLDSINKHSIATGASFTPSMFSSMSKANFLQEVVTIGDPRLGTLNETLGMMQESIHGIPNANMEMRLASRPGISGSQLQISFSGGGKFGAGTVLEVPMELADQPGVIRHGLSQQSGYAVGKYAEVGQDLKIGSTLKHEEWVLRRFQSEILPKIQTDERITSRHVRQLISEFNQNTLEGAEWIYNADADVLPHYAGKVNLASYRLNLINPINAGGGQVKSGIVGQVLKINQGGIFPSSSPQQLSKGIVSTFDARKFWWGGEAFPFERRPMQGPGRGLGPSIAAINARRSNPTRARFEWMRTLELNGMGPNLDLMERTLFIDSDKYGKLADQVLGGTLGGTGVMDPSLRSQMQFQIPLQKNLSINYEMNDKLKNLMEANQSATDVYKLQSPASIFTHGEILGHDAQGIPIHFENGMEITGGYKYTDKGGSFLKITGREIQNAGLREKVFGTDKIVADFGQGAGFIQQAIREHANGLNDFSVQEAKVLTSMDTLKKNRALHNIQMFSALQDYIQEFMNKGGVKGFKAWEWVEPRANQIIQEATTGGGPINYKHIIESAYAMTRQANLPAGATGDLPAEAIGRIFGAVPKVDKELYEEFGMKGIFNIHEQAEIERGVVHGIGQYYFGGKSNAGGLGSIEPRAFELLSAGQFGKLSGAIKDDLARRMVLANPEALIEQDTLASALHSMKHGTKITEGIASYDIANLKAGDIDTILEKGGHVNLAGTVDKASSIYIPGQENSISMRTYTTPSGLEVTPELSHRYASFLESAYGTANGAISRQATNTEFGNLIRTLGESHARTITGKDFGLARNKVMGSQYSRLISKTAEDMGDLHTVGMHEDDLKHMLSDMEKVYANDPQELIALHEQRVRLGRGETVGAIGSRDPDIGMYSVRGMKVKAINRNMIARGEVWMPQETMELFDNADDVVNGIPASKKVALGFAPGMAADFDDDNVHIMLTSSRIEKDINSHYHLNSHPELAEMDRIYGIRQQLLKARSPGENIGQVESMVAGYEKLAVSKSEVGPLSKPLSQLRAGLIQSDLSFKDKWNGAALLEALENTPISGKHISDSRIGELREQLDRLSKGAAVGKGMTLANIANEIFQVDQVSKDILTKGKTFYDKAGNQINIPGIDIDSVATNVTNTNKSFTSNAEGLSAGLLRQMLRGDKKVSFDSIDDYLSDTGGLLSGLKLPPHPTSAWNKFSKDKLGMLNKAARFGGDLMEHLGKPLAIGFGASLALGAALSRPMSNLDSSASAPPVSSGKIRSGNKTSVDPENIHPDTQSVGAPTSPQMSNPTARVNQGYNVSVRGSSRRQANIGSLTQSIRSMLPGNTNTNTTIRDNRTTLTQDRIDAIIRK